MKNIPEDISSIYKGKLSLAEALKEMDTVKKAFEITDKIEAKILAQDNIIYELQSKIDVFASCAFVNIQIEEAKNSISKTIKEKFEEFASNLFLQLNEKIGKNDIDSFVSNRCT